MCAKRPAAGDALHRESKYNLLCAICVCAAGCGSSPLGVERRASSTRRPASRPASGEALQRGFTPPPERARRPRFRPEGEERGVQALPDGGLREWEAAGVQWIEARPVSPRAPGWSGADDLQAKLALASYRGGLSLALAVKDDVHVGARYAAALDRSDHVEVELWPQRRPDRSRAADRALGLHFRLGTVKQLVQLLHPEEPWREGALSAFGVATAEGYQLEARLPLSLLTPLPAPSIDVVHYRVVVHDADARDGSAAEPTLVAEGSVKLDPPMQVPEAVQRRPSMRICMAAEPDALWGYENGWRCSVPYEEESLDDNDDVVSGLRLGHSLLVSPPTLQWIRERVVLVNIAGVQRGVMALLDKKDTILSLMHLGVVGALDPGNPLAKDSDAEPLKLPDGSFAVAVTHTTPSWRATGGRPPHVGARCSVGHRIYLSIIALRGCLLSTPFAPAPEPPSPPFLEEIFRATLEDCESSVANDWSLSKDRKVIKVHSSLYPSRPAVTYAWRDGRYQAVVK
jgi:hypothetical protein